MGPLRRARSATLLLIIALTLLVSLTDAAADVAAQRIDRAPRKVIVDGRDPRVAAEITRQGATLLVDYGAFSLWAVPSAQAAAVAGSTSVRAQSVVDTIGLRGGRAIDAGATTRSGSNGARPAGTASTQHAAAGGNRLWLVQFVGPIKESWLDDLRRDGLTPVVYMASNAYVVWGDDGARSTLEARARKSPVIQFVGAYDPSYRLSPVLERTVQQASPASAISVTVQLYTTRDVDRSVARLRAIGGRVRHEPFAIGPFTSVALDLPASEITSIAAWPDVFNVEPWLEPRTRDEAQGQIVVGNLTSSGGSIVPIEGTGAYLTWLASKGFPTSAGSYPIVAVVDDGIDNGTPSPTHPDFYILGSNSNASRLVFNLNCTADPSANSIGGHGNLNAAIAGGYNDLPGGPHQDARGFHLDLGISPYGRLGGVKIYRSTSSGEADTDFSACGGTVQGAVQAAYDAGATITSNSWGAGTPAPYGVYDALAQAYDALTRDASSAGGNQQMLHLFAAGNHGNLATTIDSPGTAKNVLTVGATENVRDDGTIDGCTADLADNADDLAGYSSRGPTSDGRIKPDLMAPGTHIQGAASQDPGYDGHSVCGDVGNQDDPHVAGSEYYPAGGQTLYTWGTGTSHATPAVAGAASLAANYYTRVLNPGQTASPALLKALLINSGRYLTGSDGGGTLPSNAQGWGDVNVGTLTDGVPRAFIDQTTLFTATGQELSRGGAVQNGSQPFRVTLVWTDAPGSTTGASYVNDLDLEVTIAGNTYKGNVFSGQYSTTGGTFDPRNNVESVFLPAGTTGAYTVRVIARNIAGDGVPGNSSALDQDFALVVSNGNLAPQAVLNVSGATIDDASGNGNGAVDPGETVSMLVGLTNVGGSAATGISSTTSTGAAGVTIQQATSTYPSIDSGSTATNSTPYRFTVPPGQPCGTQLTFQQVVSYNGGQSVVGTVPVRVGRAVTGATVQPQSSNVPAPIPDFDGDGVRVTLPVSGVTGTIADINVRVSVAHTWDDDLVLQLISPAGTVVTLSNRHGSDNDDYINTVFDDEADTAIGADFPTAWPPFTGSFRPDSPLAVLRGESPNGTWTLKVADVSDDDTGTVTAFGLDVVPVTYVCSPIARPVAGPDVTISMAHGDTFVAGQSGTYTLTVQNVSSTATSGTITVTDTLPSGLVYQSAGGSGWSCGAAGQVVTCTNAGPLQPGASTSMSLTVFVGEAAVGTVTNTASVSTSGDANSANDRATDPTTVVAPAVPACSQRARVAVSTAPGAPGQIAVAITTTAPPIQQVQFQLSNAQAARNAAVDVPRDPSIPSLAQAGRLNQTVDFTLQVGGPRLSFVVRRLADGAYTVPFIVTDACGEWPTFVGSGS